MRTPEDILAAQAKYNDILIQTELSALPEGYIAGGGISIINTDVYIDPLIANIRGKRIVKNVSTNIAEMKWLNTKVNDTYYYIYLDNYGYWTVTVNPPTAVPGLYGLYQQESNERFIGSVYVDENGDYIKVVSHMRIRAEDMDFGTITAEEIAAGSITATEITVGSLSELDPTDELGTLTTAAADALSAASDAQSTADGKIDSFYQASAPTSGMSEGDFWIDTDDGNKLYTYIGSSWVDAQDDLIGTAISNASTAQSTADGKVTTFFQDAEPTAEGVGDLWVDTDDPDNAIYRWDGTDWDDRIDLPFSFPSDDGLIAHYSLDDGQGVGGAVATYHLDGNALDLSGNGNHGTEVGNPTYVTGKSGRAIQLDGSTQYVTAPIEAIGTQDFWVSFWFKPDTVTKADNICGTGNSASTNGNGFGIQYRGNIAGDPIKLYLNDGNVSTFVNASSAAQGDLTGSFQHVFANFDRDGNATLYLNNTLIITTDISGYSGSLTATLLYIGRLGTASGSLDGAIDEFNTGVGRTLSTAEITELYNNPANTNLNQPKLPTGAIGEWDLNGDSTDTSGNGHDGVDTGITYDQGRKDNQCAVFDGSTSRIVGTTSDIGTSWAVSLWTKVSTYTQTGYLFYLKDTVSGNYIRAFRNSDNFEFDVQPGEIGNLTIPVVIDKYTHLVCMYDGTTMSFYKNGILEKTSIQSLPSFENIEFSFGASITPSVFFTDQLENIKLFPKVLTEQEILALAEQTHPVKDNSGNGNDGYSGNQLSSVQGMAGKALQFDGLADYVNLGAFQIEGTHTFSGWFKLSGGAGTNRYILIKDFNLLIRVNTANQFQVYIGNGTTWTGYTNNYIPDIDSWYHFTVISEGTSLKSYMNGVLDINTTSIYSLGSNSSILYIGALTASAFEGLIDEVRIYSRALSPEEVRGLYKFKTMPNYSANSQEINANRITRILPGVISTGLVEAKTSVIIGYQGYDAGNPEEGDRRTYVDNDEIGLEEYTGGAWSTVNSIKIGGVDSNSLFYPFLQCRGLVNPLADEINTEFFPSSNYRVFNFENNYEDQHGVDDWVIKGVDSAFSSSIKKSGSYSLTSVADTGTSTGKIDGPLISLVSGNMALGLWMYVDGSLVDYDLNIYGYQSLKSFKLESFSDGRIRLTHTTITPSESKSVTSSEYIQANTWNYIGFSYDYATKIFSLFVNKTKDDSAVFTYGISPSSIYLTLRPQAIANVSHSFYDEIIIAYEDTLDPDIFIQHYNHNVPWNTEASAKDIVIKPAEGGTIICPSGVTVPVLHVQDQKAANVDGGTFTSGAWQTRYLNTELTNTITGSSISSNQITLPAGTYKVEAFGTAYDVDRHAIRLQNITDTSTELEGMNCFVSTSDATMTNAFVKGIITIATEKIFELQHRCYTTKTTSGFGIGSSTELGRSIEIYADVFIEKIG